ncbi:GAF domain-containing protein [Piscinibacter sp. XHJ-5]|uniref:GAF domain-containing protein n=1 Tax=Piscinibacter sp. XHJ-5 TaxID=3037797 RepID=UPI002452CDA8|nr:GAF domain-containing protein [Piscinibacter sp. XHJ-5]
MPDLTAVQRICGLLDRGEIDRVQFLEQLTRQMAEEIGCERAAVRMMINSPEGAALRSMAMFDAVRGELVRVPDMTGHDSDAYFDTLLREGCVVAPDCRSHPATLPFLAGYFELQGVQSLLDVAFSVNGVLYGSFSCEQRSATMGWTPQQLKMLRQMASRASLTLMHAITAQIDTTPGALWEPSTPNRLMTMPMPLDVGKTDE